MGRGSVCKGLLEASSRKELTVARTEGVRRDEKS